MFQITVYIQILVLIIVLVISLLTLTFLVSKQNIYFFSLEFFWILLTSKKFKHVLKVYTRGLCWGNIRWRLKIFQSTRLLQKHSNTGLPICEVMPWNPSTADFWFWRIHRMFLLNTTDTKHFLAPCKKIKICGGFCCCCWFCF